MEKVESMASFNELTKSCLKNEVPECKIIPEIILGIDVRLTSCNKFNMKNDQEFQHVVIMVDLGHQSHESSQMNQDQNQNTEQDFRLRAGFETRNNNPSTNGAGNAMDFTYTDEFSSKEERRHFITRVYAILTIMLAIIFGQVALFNYSQDAKTKLTNYLVLYMVLSGFVYLVSFYALTCYEAVRRQSPLNFIVLTIMSIAVGVFMSCASIHYKLRIVTLAMLYTFAVTLSVTIIAACCPIDITKFAILICVMGTITLIIAFITFMILVYVYNEPKKADVILGGVGVFVFSIYLAFDTQVIMGGKQHEISPDEYIMAVVILLTDIINIFLCMLRLLSGSDE